MSASSRITNKFAQLFLETVNFQGCRDGWQPSWTVGRPVIDKKYTPSQQVPEASVEKVDRFGGGHILRDDDQIRGLHFTQTYRGAAVRGCNRLVAETVHDQRNGFAHLTVLVADQHVPVLQSGLPRAMSTFRYKKHCAVRCQE